MPEAGPVANIERRRTARLLAVGAGLLGALLLVSLTAVGAAAQGDPPPNRITVDVSWPDDHLVYVSYEIAAGSGPATGAGDGPYGHGCASLGQHDYADTTPNRLEINTLDHPPGEYHVAAWFTNWCLDYSDAGAEEPDPLGAVEQYPEGTPITVTATVRYWEGDRQVRSETLSDTTYVDRSGSGVETFWAVLGTVVLSDPGVTAGGEAEQGEVEPEPVVPGPGEAGETQSPAQVGEAPSDSESVFGLPSWMDPSLGAPPVDAEAQPAGSAEGASTSAARTFLLVVLLLVPIFGVAVAVALALRAWRQHRLFGWRQPQPKPAEPSHLQLAGNLLRSLSDPQADATPTQIRTAANSATTQSTLADRDPDGRPTRSDLPLHLRGTDPVHSTRPIDVIDSHHRSIGRIQPGNHYLARVVSGPWTLVQGLDDAVTGWIRTEHLSPGLPSEPSHPRGPVPTTTTGALRHLRTTQQLRLSQRDQHGFTWGGETLPTGDHLIGPSDGGMAPVYDSKYRLLGYLEEEQITPHTTTLVPSGGPTRPPPAPPLPPPPVTMPPSAWSAGGPSPPTPPVPSPP